MSALAMILTQMGCQVSGSDSKSSKKTDELENMGVRVYIGHDESNISEDTDTIVVSSAIAKDNVEVCSAQCKGIPVIHRSQVLARLFNARRGIAVSGAHGKTTTTSMMAAVLIEAGLDPAVAIGGEVPNLMSNGYCGKGEYFVAEADESDGSLVNLQPEFAIITNIDEDHLDFYENLEMIIDTFAGFVNNMKPEGEVYISSDCVNTPKLLEKITRPVISFSIKDTAADYNAYEIELVGRGSRFKVKKGSVDIGAFELDVPGEHNVSNAMAVIAFAMEKGLPVDAVRKALAGFSGAKRRFQQIGEAAGVRVIDDYAHHPVEIKATLQAARIAAKNGRVICYFQPHRFTRLQHLFEDFVQAFGSEDLLVLADVYAAGEKPIDGVSADKLKDEIVARNASTKNHVWHIADQASAVKHIADYAQNGDLVLTMGAGDIWKAGSLIISEIEERGFDCRSEKRNEEKGPALI